MTFVSIKRGGKMIKFVKVFLVLFLYCLMIFYLKYFELEPLFFIANILFFLSIIISFKLKNYYDIFLIIALINLSIIFALYAYFEIGIIIFFILNIVLFLYCYRLISTKENS